MTTNAPMPIQSMIDATNAANSAAFLECFSPEAFLSDRGRNYQGRAEIAQWDRTDNIGVQSRLHIVAIETEGDVYNLTVEVRGQGFNGQGKMAIRLDGGRISELIIS